MYITVMGVTISCCWLLVACCSIVIPAEAGIPPASVHCNFCNAVTVEMVELVELVELVFVDKWISGYVDFNSLCSTLFAIR